jgi:hypothetical protein
LSAAYKGVNALLMKEGAQDFRSGQKFDHTVFFGEKSLSEIPCNGPMRLAMGGRSCKGKDADEERQEDPPRAARRVAGGILEARGPDRS